VPSGGTNRVKILNRDSGFKDADALADPEVMVGAADEGSFAEVRHRLGVLVGRFKIDRVAPGRSAPGVESATRGYLLIEGVHCGVIIGASEARSGMLAFSSANAEAMSNVAG
jgi:hypothetical protein